MKISLSRNLGPIKDAACEEIDKQAEAERLKYVTPGTLQAATYQAKGVEAERYITTGGEGDYPILTREADVTGVSIADLAAVVSATAQQWMFVLSVIEGKRMGAKKRVREATTLLELNEAKNVDWSINVQG